MTLESQNKNAKCRREGRKANIQPVTLWASGAQSCWGPSEEPCRMNLWRMARWGGPFIHKPESLFGLKMPSGAYFQLCVCTHWDTEALEKPWGKKKKKKLKDRTVGTWREKLSAYQELWTTLAAEGGTWVRDVTTSNLSTTRTALWATIPVFSFFYLPTGPLLITSLRYVRRWPETVPPEIVMIPSPWLGNSTPFINHVLKVSHFLTLVFLGLWVGLAPVTGSS